MVRLFPQLLLQDSGNIFPDDIKFNIYRGPGLDLVTTCLIVEEVSKQCPSTAMCYKMHLEAVEAISLIPTQYQLERYIQPLLQGEMFAAAPGGEPHGQTGDDWTPVRQKVTTLPRVKGGFHIGLMHGLYCLGCCWALMMLLFVGGVMNLWWIAALTIFVLLEKIAPLGAQGGRLSGWLIIGFGVFNLVQNFRH